MIAHEPHVPPGSIGDYSCKVCGVRLGSFQVRPGQPTLLAPDDTVHQACKAVVPASKHDDQAMHENCRDAVLQWWYWRQGTLVDRLGNVDRSSGPVEYFTLERESA